VPCYLDGDVLVRNQDCPRKFPRRGRGIDFQFAKRRFVLGYGACLRTVLQQISGLGCRWCCRRGRNDDSRGCGAGYPRPYALRLLVDGAALVQHLIPPFIA